MKSFRFFLLCFICFIAPIDKFYISIGFRVNYFEVVMLAFILVSILQFLRSGISYKRNHAVQFYITMQWAWVAIVILSGFSFIYIAKTSEQLSFFAKGLFQLIIYSIFFTLTCFYVTKLSVKQVETILKCLVYSMLISSIYGMVQIFTMLYMQIDLDYIISKSLPLAGSEASFENLGWGRFFRLNGLSGDPSVHASFCIPVMMILIYFIFFKKQYKYLFHLNIILISFICTVSGSGLTGFSTALVVLSILNLKNIKASAVVAVVVLLIPLFVLFLSFYDQIVYIAGKKFESGGTTSDHLSVAMNSIELALHYPLFGVGYNNFSSMYEKYFHFSGFNPHNSYLSYFVETGFVGLLFKTFAAAVITFLLFKKRDAFSYVVLAAFVGTNVASLGYETLNIFFNQFIVLILLLISQSGYGSLQSRKNSA